MRDTGFSMSEMEHSIILIFFCLSSIFLSTASSTWSYSFEAKHMQLLREQNLIYWMFRAVQSERLRTDASAPWSNPAVTNRKDSFVQG